MRRPWIVLGVTLAALGVGLAGIAGWLLYPHADPQPLPAPLIAFTSSEGQALLDGAEASADYAQLATTFQTQRLVSYCGVATSVAVLAALGKNTSQADFFTSEASRARSRVAVMFRGMTLLDLAALLRAHGVRISIHHAHDLTIAEFRATVQRNLSDPDNYLIVNYQRQALGQGKMGHISPLAAYDRESDSVLIMDTAGNKYPPTWVPLELLLAGMRTTDSASGRLRGYVEVSR